MLDALVVAVLLDVEGDGGYTDGLAREPANALQREHLVGVVGERFILATSAGGVEVRGVFAGGGSAATTHTM